MKNISLLLLLAVLCINCKGNAQKEKSQSGEIAVAEPERVKDHNFPLQKSDAEWKKELTEDQYYILREAGTEKPRSSSLLHLKAKGEMVCAACGNPLFDNQYQFVSGTGWPSFDRPIKGGVLLGTDNKLGYKRNEVLCARCGGHLGHRFNDGPKETTGLRYCMDGAAMKFIPADKIKDSKKTTSNNTKNKTEK